MAKNITLEFSLAELETLKNVVVEAAMQMDDDGRDGAFAASPLRPVYEKVKAALAKAEAA